MISGDPVSKHVPKRDSRLQDNTKLLNLFNKVYNEELKSGSEFNTIVGRAVLSAILFGGLLDWNGLEKIYNSICLAERPPQDGWLDYVTVGSIQYPSMPRRWKVDRRTLRIWNIAIVQQEFLKKKYRGNNVQEALDEHLNRKPRYIYDRARPQVDQLYSEARIWWRQRLPPVLAAHLEGDGPSRAVPRDNWDRLLGQPADTSERRQASEAVSPGNNRAPDASRREQRRIVVKNPIPSDLATDLAHIAGALKSAQSIEIANATRSAEAARLLGQLDLSSTCGVYIKDWFLECLTQGYDQSENRRRKVRRTVSPSTLARDLGLLRHTILPGLNMLPAMPSAGELIKLYSNELSDQLRQSDIERRLRTIRRFHRWLAHNASFPQLRFTFNPRGPRDSVKARLVSETEYFNALEKADARGDLSLKAAIRVGLILGFRAGLRPDEFTALQAGDFRISSEGLVLIIKPNHHARLKTSNARRLLPLHLLLTPVEQAEVVQLVRLRQRLRGKIVRGPMLLHDAVKPQDVIEQSKSLVREIQTLLKEVTGDPEARYYDLRHSFASYLTATLLLPEGMDDRLSPAIGPDCVSAARRERLWPHLLGRKSKGRSALYAVSFLMGHASPEWTLVYYNHLLDWSAAQHVSRYAPANKNALVSQGTAQDQEQTHGEHADLQPIDEPLHAETWPEWPFVVQALSELIDGASLPQTAVAYGINESLLGIWLKRLRTVVGLKTRTGRQRHRFVASTRSAGPDQGRSGSSSRPRFLLPREDSGLNVISRVWRACGEGRDDLLARPKVVWALRCFLHQADPARCDVRFDNCTDAISYIVALTQLGLEPGCFRVRLQRAGTADRSPLLELPHPFDNQEGWERLMAATYIGGQPIGQVSRFRVSIVSNEAASARATPSHKVALLLAAITAQFPLLEAREA